MNDLLIFGIIICTLISSFVAYKIGQDHGSAGKCFTCLKNGLEIGYQAGVVHSQNLKIEIQEIKK